MRVRLLSFVMLAGGFVFALSWDYVLRRSSAPAVVGAEISGRLYGAGNSGCVSGDTGASFDYCTPCGVVNPQSVGCGGTSKTVWKDCVDQTAENCTFPTWEPCN